MTTSQFLNSKLNGMTVYRLAKLTGITPQHLGRVFKGQNDPTIEKFKLIVKALNIDNNEILEFLNN